MYRPPMHYPVSPSSGHPLFLGIVLSIAMRQGRVEWFILVYLDLPMRGVAYVFHVSMCMCNARLGSSVLAVIF